MNIIDKNIKYDFNTARFDNRSNFHILNYVICSTPRSGSTLLSKGLMSTKIVGLPHEYFNVEHKRDYFNRWEFETLIKYIKLLVKNRVSDNGVFGFKIHFNQFDDVFNGEKLDNYFKDLKYIFITREDHVLQGISLEKAYQTNKWSSEFDSKKDAKFDYNRINSRIKEVIREEINWQNYFKEHKIEPLLVRYEDLDNNYEGTIKRVIRYLNQDASIKIPEIPIKKQRNISSFYWKKIYKLISFFKR